MKISIMAFLLLISSYGWCQSYQTTFEEAVSADGINTVIISNVYGAVDIQGTSGNKIDISVESDMSGHNQAQLDRLIEGISLGIEQWADTLLIYNKAPWLCEPYLSRAPCNYQWHSPTDGDYTFDLRVVLPSSLNLEAATINHGDINIVGVSGRVSVDNVNGSINLEGVSNVVKASTINGELTAQFDKAPTVPGSFYALNGDIRSAFPDDLSADIGFKSFNGEFFTDFEFESSRQATELEVNESSSGTEYKLETKSGISVGGGGVALRFETLNGNMYVKRK